MFTLDVIDPPNCDAQHVPLDWDRCLTCKGSGKVGPPESGWPDRLTLSERFLSRACQTCNGRGSLRAAALAEKERLRREAWSIFTPPLDKPYDSTVRCEDCGHPMAEGSWEDWPDHAELPTDYDFRFELADLLAGREPEGIGTFYSSCDERCEHGGPGRILNVGGMGQHQIEGIDISNFDPELAPVEASWRAVDVRTLGHACDLRPHKLAILCLRCYAAR